MEEPVDTIQIELRSNVAEITLFDELDGVHELKIEGACMSGIFEALIIEMQKHRTRLTEIPKVKE